MMRDRPRFADPSARVKGIIGRIGGAGDPIVDRLRLKAVERELRQRGAPDTWRVEAETVEPACDGATYGISYVEVVENGDDRVRICVAKGDDTFANRPFRFADEPAAVVEAGSGSCANPSHQGPVAAYLFPVAGLDPARSYRCLIQASAAVGGDADIRLAEPCATDWLPVSRDAATTTAPNHNHTISQQGPHGHDIAISGGGSHAHSTGTQDGHEHKISTFDGHNHTGTTTNAGGHSHSVSTSGQHGHPGSSATDAGAHAHGGQTGNDGTHGHRAAGGGGLLVQRVCEVSGVAGFTVRLEYRSARAGEEAACRSASASVQCSATS